MLGAIERGQRRCKPDYAPAIDRVLATGTLVTDWTARLSATTGLPSQYETVGELEEAASTIREYQLGFVPGRLQTSAYARAVLRIGSPRAAEDELDALVATRLARQELLTGARRPLYQVVVDETVLRRPIGGRGTMGPQLAHLAAMSALPNISVQVVPMTTERHPGLSGSFELYTTSEGPVVYLESRISGESFRDTASIDEYEQAFGDLRGVALPPEASRELIETVQGEAQ